MTSTVENVPLANGIGGRDDLSELGSYTLTTMVAPGGDFTCGDFPVIAGSAYFPSSISDSNSCLGEARFGPNVGQPLIFQGRGARLEAGKSYTVSITGLGAPQVALFVAALPLASGVD